MTLKRFARYLLRHAFIRFALVGACGYAVAMGVLAFDTGVLRLNFEAGNALSIFIAMCFTWMGNRYLTFRESRARGAAAVAQEFLKFVGANIVGAAVNYGVSVLLVHYAAWPFGNPFVAQACGVLAGLIFNFTLSKKLVFRKSH